MKYTDNAINILTVKTFKGIGRAWIVRNLKGNEKINTILSLLNKKLKDISIKNFEEAKKMVKKNKKVRGFY